MPINIAQYRPINAIETAINDGLTTRFVSDTSDNINNFVWRVANYNLVSQNCFGGNSLRNWKSLEANTDENVIGYLGRGYVIRPFSQFAILANHIRTNGSDSVTWKLYWSITWYKGPQVMDTDRFVGAYDSVTIATTNSNSDFTLTTTYTDIWDNMPEGYGGGQLCFLVTAENGDGSTRAKLNHLDIIAGKYPNE